MEWRAYDFCGEVSFVGKGQVLRNEAPFPWSCPPPRDSSDKDSGDGHGDEVIAAAEEQRKGSPKSPQQQNQSPAQRAGQQRSPAAKKKKRKVRARAAGSEVLERSCYPDDATA